MAGGGLRRPVRLSRGAVQDDGPCGEDRSRSSAAIWHTASATACGRTWPRRDWRC